MLFLLISSLILAVAFGDACADGNGDQAICAELGCAYNVYDNTCTAAATTTEAATTSVPATTAAATTSIPTDPATTCYCPTISTAPTTTTTSTTKKSKDKKGSTSGTAGIGDCDCDKDYGVVELRFIYQGADNGVDIEIFYDKDTKQEVMCQFTDVQVDDEIVCGITGYGDFANETPFTITHSDGTTCEAQFHTSCSSDIVGLVQPECTELKCSGWRDGNPTTNDCDDGVEPCECPEATEEPCTPSLFPCPLIYAPVCCADDGVTYGSACAADKSCCSSYIDGECPTTTFEPDFVDKIIGENCYCDTGLTPSPTSSYTSSKSKSKHKKKGSKDSAGLGVGDCECDKDYGMTELRLLYSGSDTVDISFGHKDGDIMCTVSDVATGGEATCNVDSYVDGNNQQIFSKLSTNTYVKVTTASGNTEVCQTEVHTSCSRDIVGTYGDGGCGTDIIVTGWRDGNPNDDNDCDDGFEICSCDGIYIDPMDNPESDPVVEFGGDICFCSNLDATSSITSVSQLTSSTAAPGTKSKQKKRSKDSGFGFGSCDCDGGMTVLRFVYTNTNDAATSITAFVNGLDGDILCSFDDVSFGQENECKISDVVDGNNDPLYSKLEKDTYVRIVTDSGSCEGSWHTSCSRDIIGWAADGCDDVIVSGWADNNSPSQCDDGFEPCTCETATDPCSGLDMYSCNGDCQGDECSVEEDGCVIDAAGTGFKCYSTDQSYMLSSNAHKYKYIMPIIMVIVAFISFV